MDSKKVTLTFSLAILLIFLSGCTPGRYTRADFTNAQFSRDKLECEQTSNRLYPVSRNTYQEPAQTSCTTYGTQTDCTTYPGKFVQSEDVNVYSRAAAWSTCIQGKGYKWNSPEWAWSQEESTIQEQPTTQIWENADYSEGLDDYERGYYSAAKYIWMPLAEQGDARAQHGIGTMFDQGQGVTQDLTEAVKWYRLAAEQGYSLSEYNLGVSYYKGEGVSQDYEEAVKWFRRGAAQNEIRAQFALGLMYYKGKGVPKDYKEAAKWYRIAADQGLAEAQTNLGELYKSGKGVPKDYKEAVKWTRLAAEQGVAMAQSNLGEFYETGKGVPKDNKEAISWYRLAADQGFVKAQTKLEKMNARDKGAQ